MTSGAETTTNAAEIHFDNTGSLLYVAEVGTSLIDITLLDNGNSASTVARPLDNAFTRFGRYMYVVTGSGSIIGYQVKADGSLTALTLNAAVPPGARGLVAE